jgi:glycosyltransferase involved in cell wall biosynthesis
MNELCELRRRGHAVIIFALKDPKERIVQERAKEFSKDVFYSPFVLSARLWKAQIFFLTRRPLVYLRALLDIVRHSAKRPSVCLKNVVIFPKSAHFAFRALSAGVRHIHAHFANYPATSALIVSQLTGIPFSFTCHAHDIFYDATMLDVKIQRAKACIAVSEYNREFILGLYPCLPQDKVRVLRCGITPEDFSSIERPRGDSKLRILSVGRLVPTKGFDDLIRACGIVKKSGIDFVCDIIGEGPIEGQLKELVRNLGLQERVRLVGPLEERDTAGYYGKADVFVLASKRARGRDVQDGIPIVLMEAMACRVPVISTNISGIPELIRDGVNGFLVDPGAYEEIAEKMLTLYRDQNARERLIENARHTVAAGSHIRKTVDVLEELFYG